jgi:uncharacterized membrane protein YfcA
VKIPAYVVTGAMPSELFALAACMCVLSWLGAYLATRLLRGMRAGTFRRLLDGVLAAIAVWLLLDVLREAA